MNDTYKLRRIKMQEQKVGVYYPGHIRPNRLDCRKVAKCPICGETIDETYRLTNRKGDRIFLNRDDAVVMQGKLEVALKL